MFSSFFPSPRLFFLAAIVWTALTRPGGRLVYCTCSLEPEEGEEQARAFLARYPQFRRVPVESDEVPGLPEALTPEGDVRTLPCQGGPGLGSRGLDGFFAARFLRAEG